MYSSPVFSSNGATLFVDSNDNKVHAITSCACGDGMYRGGDWAKRCTPCPKGSYCPDDMTMLVCPPTTYGSALFLTGAACTGPCEAGYDGSNSGQTSATCGGKCPAGYYCRKGQLPEKCGSANHYCPAGSTEPTTIGAGYYSTPITSATDVRSDQNQCEDGHLCAAGVLTPCVAGGYCKGGGDHLARSQHSFVLQSRRYPLLLPKDGTQNQRVI